VIGKISVVEWPAFAFRADDLLPDRPFGSMEVNLGNSMFVAVRESVRELHHNPDDGAFRFLS
jgi:hypothetical protein